jgi:hypothetical protein
VGVPSLAAPLIVSSAVLGTEVVAGVPHHVRVSRKLAILSIRHLSRRIDESRRQDTKLLGHLRGDCATKPTDIALHHASIEIREERNRAQANSRASSRFRCSYYSRARN